VFSADDWTGFGSGPSFFEMPLTDGNQQVARRGDDSTGDSDIPAEVFEVFSCSKAGGKKAGGGGFQIEELASHNRETAGLLADPSKRHNEALDAETTKFLKAGIPGPDIVRPEHKCLDARAVLDDEAAERIAIRDRYHKLRRWPSDNQPEPDLANIKRSHREALARIRTEPDYWAELCADYARLPERPAGTEPEPRELALWQMEALSWIVEPESDADLEDARRNTIAWLRSGRATATTKPRFSIGLYVPARDPAQRSRPTRGTPFEPTPAEGAASVKPQPPMSLSAYALAQGKHHEELRRQIKRYCGAVAKRIKASGKPPISPDVRAMPNDVIVIGFDAIADATNRTDAKTQRLIEDHNAPIAMLGGQPVALRSMLRKYRSKADPEAVRRGRKRPREGTRWPMAEWVFSRLDDERATEFHSTPRGEPHTMSLTEPAPLARMNWTKRAYGEAYNLSDRSLDRAIADGRLRASKVFGAWRISPEDGERFARGLPPLPGDPPRPKIRSISGRGC
jgi:hypothetical protein